MNGRKMHFVLELPVTVDIEAIWKQISHYHRVNLGGINSYYTVSFTGEISDGCEILNYICNICDAHVTVDSSYS